MYCDLCNVQNSRTHSFCNDFWGWGDLNYVVTVGMGSSGITRISCNGKYGKTIYKWPLKSCQVMQQTQQMFNINSTFFQPRQIQEIKDFLLTARRKDAKCKYLWFN